MMKLFEKKSQDYVPPTIRWVILWFACLFTGVLFIFFVGWSGVRFSEKERNIFGIIGTSLVYGATLMTLLGLMHDHRVKAGKQALRIKLKKKQSDILLNKDAIADRSADIAASEIEIADIQAKLIPFEKYPDTIRRLMPFAISTLALGSSCLLLSYG